MTLQDMNNNNVKKMWTVIFQNYNMLRTITHPHSVKLFENANRLDVYSMVIGSVRPLMNYKQGAKFLYAKLLQQNVALSRSI